MNARRIALATTMTALLGAGLSLAPASGASTASVIKQCAQGHPASYRLKRSDAAFARSFLNCVIAADGLRAKASDRVPMGYGKGLGSFDKRMASTVAGFAAAPKQDATLSYVNAKLEKVYDVLSEPFPREWYTFWADTTPPPPTPSQIAAQVAAAREQLAAFTRKALNGHPPKYVAIDVVVQKGAWFHDGTGSNLRFMVLFYYQAG